METIDIDKEDLDSNTVPRKRKPTWRMVPGTNTESMALQVLLLCVGQTEGKELGFLGFFCTKGASQYLDNVITDTL